MKQGRRLYTHQADNNKKVCTLHFTMFKNKYLALGLCWCPISGASTGYHYRSLNAPIYKIVWFGHFKLTFQYAFMRTLDLKVNEPVAELAITYL
jgi:hypothetical protein